LTSKVAATTQRPIGLNEWLGPEPLTVELQAGSTIVDATNVIVTANPRALLMKTTQVGPDGAWRFAYEQFMRMP